jgi:hypothetical protein
MQKYFTEILLGAILIVMIYGAFAGGNSKLGAVDYALTSRFSGIEVVNPSSTTTIAVGSTELGTSKGKVCVYNGTQYTVLSFAAGSTTPGYATSTSCQ